MGYSPNKYISSHHGNVNEFWANFDNLSLQCYNTVVIRLQGALGYKTHPQFGNFIIACFETENIAKILGYKTHCCLGSKDRSSLL